MLILDDVWFKYVGNNIVAFGNCGDKTVLGFVDANKHCFYYTPDFYYTHKYAAEHMYTHRIHKILDQVLVYALHQRLGLAISDLTGQAPERSARKM